jgi:hypothetical protein
LGKQWRRGGGGRPTYNSASDSMAFIEIKKKRRMRGGIRNVGQITIEDL